MSGSAWSVRFLASASWGAAIEDGRGRPGKDRDGDQGMNDVVMRIIVIVIVSMIFIDLYIAVIYSHWGALIVAKPVKNTLWPNRCWRRPKSQEFQVKTFSHSCLKLVS